MKCFLAMALHVMEIEHTTIPVAATGLVNEVSAKLRESILVGSQNSAVCVFCCFCIVWLREGGLVAAVCGRYIVRMVCWELA